MGKAFVAKLAKQGARDPEALAAWIGRKKHGKAFGKLAAAGRKNSGKSDSKTQQPASPKPDDRRAAGIAALASHQNRESERARQENAERRKRNTEALAEINAAPGKANRKAMSKQERALVNYEANGASISADAFERLRPFADESAQTNRVDVLKARAFQKARDTRIKNGWLVPGEASPTPSTPSAPARQRNPVEDARQRATEDQQQGARERLRIAAEQRTAARENRSSDVDAAVEQIQALDQRYSSGLGGGNLSRVSDERLARFLRVISDLSARPPAEFNRTETRVLVQFGHRVRSEANRRGL